jgi:GntR family transcriptional regulator / MocR family aminotransferase
LPKRAANPLAPALAIERGGSEPLHRQIYFAIRQAILGGALRPGARLPATRALARQLAVSRNTVMAAFEQLHAEGYVDGKVGAGSFVSHHLPEAVLGARGRTPRSAAAPPARPGPSLRGAQLIALRSGRSLARPFSPGVPELEQFPFDDWARLLARRWRRPRRAFLVGGDPAGYRPLCQAIADYLASARAVSCSPEQVIVVSGTQQALDLAARVLVNPGDPVWIEEPGYPPSRAVLLAAGARPVPVAIDEEGLSVVQGRAAEPGARLIAVSPSHQFPLGVTMSLKRRLELLDQARAAGGFVLEDDYDSEYRYAGRPLAALQGLDRDGRVIYVGTMSKVMFPGLRLGYMVVPEHLVEAFVAVRRITDTHPTMLAQPALAEFIAEGHLAQHIRRMRSLYAERQRLFLDACARHAEGLIAAEPAAAGMHLVGRLPPALSDRAVSAAARERGIEAPALSTFYVEHPPRPGLLLGYTGVTPGEIERGVRTLAGAVRACLGQTTTSPGLQAGPAAATELHA